MGDSTGNTKQKTLVQESSATKHGLPGQINVPKVKAPVLDSTGDTKQKTLVQESSATKNRLLGKVHVPDAAIMPEKVSIIGAGPVGINLAFTILEQGITSEIAIVDSDATKLTAEALDMQAGQLFFTNSKVVGSSDDARTLCKKVEETEPTNEIKEEPE